MATTYSGDPRTSDKDAVRFLCQDNDMTPGVVRLQDEEILYLLSVQANVFLAAAEAADTIAGYWARIQNVRVGPLALQRSQAPTFFRELAAALRRNAARNAQAAPVFFPAGNNNYINTNGGLGGPEHLFNVGMDDFPGFSLFWPPADMPPLYSYP
jgi:hypothetical protein